MDWKSTENGERRDKGAEEWESGGFEESAEKMSGKRKNLWKRETPKTERLHPFIYKTFFAIL